MCLRSAMIINRMIMDISCKQTMYVCCVLYCGDFFVFGYIYFIFVLLLQIILWIFNMIMIKQDMIDCFKTKILIWQLQQQYNLHHLSERMPLYITVSFSWHYFCFIFCLLVISSAKINATLKVKSCGAKYKSTRVHWTTIK